MKHSLGTVLRDASMKGADYILNNKHTTSTYQGRMFGWGTTPGAIAEGGSAVQGWAPGAIYLDLDASAGARVLYNAGSNTAASWKSAGTLDAAQTWDLLQTFTVGINTASLQIGSVTVNATAAEINNACDVSARIVNTTATSLAVTAATHGGKIVTINSAAPIAITLPGATGTGDVFTFIVGTNATGTAHTISTGNTTANFAGVSIIAQTDTAQVNGFLTTATDNTISLNGTTKGGIKGDKIVIVDITTNVYQVTITGGASGTVVTPFSHV